MSEARKCDRCEKFYLLADSEDRPATTGCKFERVQLQTDSGRNIVVFDLCADCANKVFDFLVKTER